MLPEVLPAGGVELRRCREEMLAEVMSAIELSQAELARWMPWADPMPTIEAEREFLRASERAFDADQSWGFCLIEPETGALVGGAGLDPKGPERAEIGYWVRSDRTRRGYATAAASALTAAAFVHLPQVTQVVIRMDQANVASAAIPPKLGYSLDGEEFARDIVTAGHSGRGWIWAMARPA